MKSYSIVFIQAVTKRARGLVVGKRVRGRVVRKGAVTIPRSVIVGANLRKRRIDVKPCSTACGDMTPAPPGTTLFMWGPKRRVAIPAQLIRSIQINP